MGKKRVLRKNRSNKQVSDFPKVKNYTNNDRFVRANTNIFRQDMIRKLLSPDRDINFSCGYPDSITMDDYKRMYDREGLAAKVVTFLSGESWAMIPKVFENEKGEETEFEKAWEAIQKDKNLYHYLQRIDSLSGIGEFGILLLGIDDGKQLNEPVDGINLKTGEKVGDGKKKHKLLYLKPFDQSVVKIKTNEIDVASPRYGFPTIYSIDFASESSESSSSTSTKEVHWTRVLHVADNRDTSETLGIPRMKNVYNRILDVRKILSGSGEMFWKGGFPGYSLEVNPDLDVTLEAADKVAIRKEMKDYSDGLQRYIALTGISVKSLEPQVSDPKGHIDAQIKYIALSMSVPYRIFIGTEEAKLSSTQDVKTINKRIAKRQEGYLTPMVLRPLVDRLMAYGVLPDVEEYFVEWPDLNIPTDEDKAKVALVKTEALAKYVQAGLDSLIAPKEYLMIIFGMTEEEAKVIEDAAIKFLEEHPPEPEPELVEPVIDEED